MSCLYRALSRFHNNINTDQLRQLLCNYLQSNPTLGGMKASDSILHEKNISLQQYVNQMRNNSEWGGAIEIKAYCDIFSRNVSVKSLPNNKNIEFLSEKKSNILDKIYWTGGHYEAIGSEIINNPNISNDIKNKNSEGVENNKFDRNTSRISDNTISNATGMRKMYNRQPQYNGRRYNNNCNCINCINCRKKTYY